MALATAVSNPRPQLAFPPARVSSHPSALALALACRRQTLPMGFTLFALCGSFESGGAELRSDESVGMAMGIAMTELRTYR